MDASQKQEAIKVLSDPETVKKVTEKAIKRRNRRELESN